jgi:molybdopterin-guanine dinucleotide biosynthesis protein A
MGRDKASLPFGPESVLERVLRLVSATADRIVISAAPGQVVPPGHEVCRDEAEDQGPLPGILAGLGRIGREHVLVIACDMPLIQPGLTVLLAELCAGWDGAVPFVDRTRVPTCAVYAVAALRQRAAGFGPARNRSLQDFIAGLSIREVPPAVLRQADPDLLSLTPCNTPADYRNALAIAGLAVSTPSSGPCDPT